MKNLFFFIFFALCPLTNYAQTGTASPGWTVSVPANTITEAGTNYTTNFASAINQTLLSYNLSKQGNFDVFIHKIDASWDSRLSLWAVRTGNGVASGGGSTSGGTTFMQLTSSPQSFITGGSGNSTTRTNIPIQYEIRGLSVLIPVKTYTTTVVFTITN